MVTGCFIMLMYNNLSDSPFVCTWVIWFIFAGGILAFNIVKPVANNSLISFSNVKYSYFFHQIRLVAQSCLTLCNPMNRSTPGLPVHHQLPEFTQTLVHRVSDAIQPSQPLSSPSLAPNPSQHQSLFQWVNSSHEVAKILEFQL